MARSDNNIPERFTWAAQVLSVAPADTLLELGCGAGILAGQVAALLGKGTITAIDRSAPMISRASRRNATFIEKNKARFIQADIADAPPGKAERYNKIFAFNFSTFWKDPAATLAFVRRHLRPGGQFYLFYQPPHNVTREMAAQAREKLEQHGFRAAHTIIKALAPAAAFCIMAVPYEP